MRFAKPNPNKQKEQERIEKESKEASDEAIGHAQNCLHTEDFLKYKKSMEVLFDKTMTELMWVEDNVFGVEQYALACKKIIGRYKNLGMLLNTVESESGK